MPRMKRTIDERLLGTWKSDRRRTFRDWKPLTGHDPPRTRKFKALFGKLLVRWTRTTIYSEYAGTPLDPKPYEVVASDPKCVVIRSRDFLSGELRLETIRFEDDRYWITLEGGFVEWFRRIDR